MQFSSYRNSSWRTEILQPRELQCSSIDPLLWRCAAALSTSTKMPSSLLLIRQVRNGLCTCVPQWPGDHFDLNWRWTRLVIRLMFCSINTFRHKGVFFPLKFRSVTSAEIPLAADSFETPLFVTVQKHLCYSRSNSAKCPASGACNVS
jgi:hypothetical protein